MSASAPHAESTHNSAHLPRILVVDDDMAALRLLSVGLVSAGFEVATTASGEDALALIAQMPPDAVVLDFEMPNLDGAEVCARIRGAESIAIKELPVIMLTAHTSEADELRCLEAGANDFVTKPVSRAVLRARIQTQLRLRAYARQLEEWRAIREADLASAQATQKAFVPASPPPLFGWSVQARYTPLIQVGGDTYGWERLADGRWLFWMSDGTGHGAAAALITALASHLFSKAAEMATSPSEILTAVNREFLRAVGGSVFMTACCAVVAEDGTMTFSSAGHPPILILRHSGQVEAHWPEKTIIGLGEGLSLGDTTITLGTDDVALLYTDGLYSCKTNEGDRMSHKDVEAAAAEGPLGANLIDELISRIHARSNSAPVDDDLAIIALRRTT